MNINELNTFEVLKIKVEMWLDNYQKLFKKYCARKPFAKEDELDELFNQLVYAAEQVRIFTKQMNEIRG